LQAVQRVAAIGFGKEDARMNSGRNRHWMWADAVDLLDRMQRLHRQSYAPVRPAGGMARWEPPADLIETDHEVLVFVALPGVDIAQTEAFIEDGVLVVRGHRVLPPALRTARIHRLELPQGRFERRLPLPGGQYDGVRRESADGCLLVTLSKANGGRW
jgi:HSP20 family molecular chaperone IbpA